MAVASERQVEVVDRRVLETFGVEEPAQPSAPQTGRDLDIAEGGYVDVVLGIGEQGSERRPGIGPEQDLQQS